MPVPELGRLEPVNVRDIWEHEAQDFTPWLADIWTDWVRNYESRAGCNGGVHRAVLLGHPSQRI